MFKKKYKATAKVGGIFWRGYDIDLGTFCFAWSVWLKSKFYVLTHPHREVTVSKL